MKRVASLYLPNWSIDRIRRTGRPHAAPPEPRAASSAALEGLGAMGAEAAAERENACSAPRGGGWRPGARWAKLGRGNADVEAAIAALPQHQRPPMRELGRRSEAADPPFRHGRADAAAVPSLPLHESGTGSPMATVTRNGARVELVAVSPEAAALGLRPGMALVAARMQLPELAVRDSDPDGDAAELARLADLLARRWSPMVAISDPDGIAIDLTGVAHLHGGEAKFAARLVALLARHGFAARVAIAGTLGAAWALARHGGGEAVRLVESGRDAEAVAVLPPAALRLDPPSLDLLARLGVDSIAQLLAMPRAPLVRRFGGRIITRLDQAVGRMPEPLIPVRPATAVRVVRRFNEPIATAPAIAFWLERLVPDLARALAEAGQGARSIELVADRVDGVPQRLRIGFARPTRDAGHMLRLLARRIEEIAPGYGIDAMGLHVRRSDPLGAESLAPALAGEAVPELATLVDAIVNRIGGERLWRLVPVESGVPERCVAPGPPLDEGRRRVAALARDDVRQFDQRLPDHPWHPHRPRPGRLLARPERVDHVIAELPDQPPRRFTWRGRTYRVVAAEGPERIAGEWWRRAGERTALRDYFRVEADSGERFWLYRRGDGVCAATGDLSWYIHGR